MSSSHTAELAPRSFSARLQSRLAGLLVLAAALGMVAALALHVVRAVTDGWVAPILLSPDNDAVIQLRLGLHRQLAELGRAEAEITRIDGDLEAVGAAIERLSGLRRHARQTLTWQAGVQGEEHKAVSASLGHLREQRAILERLVERQGRLTARTREDLAAGLVDRTELEKQEQALDSLAVSLVENRRLIEEAEQQLRLLASDARALKNAFARPADVNARQPTVAAGEEHEARIELELVRLETEQRSLQAIRRVAVENVDKQRALLEELQKRPLYRAMNESTHVAFIPYSQLEAVAPGSRVFACVWGLFQCRDAGLVTEVVPGEVVTQDPWGEMARGQYAVLELSDPEAIREKVLRIRRL